MAKDDEVGPQNKDGQMVGRGSSRVSRARGHRVVTKVGWGRLQRPLTVCVILVKSLALSEPSFSICSVRLTPVACLGDMSPHHQSIYGLRHGILGFEPWPQPFHVI